MDLPFTGSDLRDIANICDLVDQLDVAPADAAGLVPPGTDLVTSPMVGRIEIYRPGGGTELIGHITPHDDWHGFVPLVETETAP